MKKNLLRTIALFAFTALVLGIEYIIVREPGIFQNSTTDTTAQEVLGKSNEVLSPISSDGNNTLTTEPSSREDPAPIQIPKTIEPINFSPKQIPSEIPFSVNFTDMTNEIMEGGQVTFSWMVNGSAKTIRSTVVYYGKISTPGELSTNTAPVDTKYSDIQRDFAEGSYVIPLLFVGSAKVMSPGTYYARANASIDGKYYWSSERQFIVKPTPRHEIRIIDYPKIAKVASGIAFTWEILGPQATTGFTTVVGAKESKPGVLNETTDLNQTSYKILTNEFIGGNYYVPLRFVGNSVIQETGTYYIRALAFINGKNIWSEEQIVVVE